MKIRLTEAQYQKLQQFITETPLDVAAKNNIKTGDFIGVVFNGGTVNKFRVIDSIGGQILMDNVDKGSANINYRYWFAPSSLNGDTLELRRVHKTKQPEMMKEKPTSWPIFSIKNITKMVIADASGKEKDSVDIVPSIQNTSTKTQAQPAQQTPQADYTDLLIDLLVEMMKLKDDNTIKFEMLDGSDLIFCSVSKNGTSYELELNDSTGNRDKYNYLRDYRVVVELPTNPEEAVANKTLSTPDGKKFILKVNLLSGENTKEFELEFTKFLLGGACSDIEAKKQDRVDRKTTKEKERAERVLKFVLSDPLLKKAFIHTPSLFGLIKLGDPKGIIPAEKILNGFMLNKTKEKLGVDADKFKSDKKVLFSITDTSIKKTLGKDSINLNVGDNYQARIKPFTYSDKGIVLVSSKPNFKLFIRGSLGENKFRATLVKDYTKENGSRETYKQNITIQIKDYDY